MTEPVLVTISKFNALAEAEGMTVDELIEWFRARGVRVKVTDDSGVSVTP